MQRCSGRKAEGKPHVLQLQGGVGHRDQPPWHGWDRAANLGLNVRCLPHTLASPTTQGELKGSAGIINL